MGKRPRNKDKSKDNSTVGQVIVVSPRPKTSPTSRKFKESPRASSAPSAPIIDAPENIKRLFSEPSITTSGSPGTTPPRPKHLSFYDLLTKKVKVQTITVELPSPSASPETPRSKPKRDEIILSPQEIILSPPEVAKRDSNTAANTALRRRWSTEPRHWWLCRKFRWIYDFCVAFIRVTWRDQRTFVDAMLSVGVLALLLYGSYHALDPILKIIPGAAAQELDGNCSVVYVTVPGPIVTVSLIGASPTNPARGTYYFSVINGTTEWLNSIAPPSRFSTFVTRTPGITPVVSSLLVTAPSSPELPTVPPTGTLTVSALPSPSPTSPGIPTTFTTSLISGSTLITSVITSTPDSAAPVLQPSTSSVSLPSATVPMYSISSLLLSINQPQGPYPSYLSSYVSTSIVTVSDGLSTTVSTLLTTIVPSSIPNSITLGTPPIVPGPSSSPGVSSIITSTVLMTTTSIVPGGSATTLTSTSITTLSGVIPAVSPGPATPTIPGLPTTLTSTISGGPTTTITSILASASGVLIPGSTSGASLALTSSVTTTLTSILPGGATTIITSTLASASTPVPTFSGAPSSPALPVSSSILTTLTRTDLSVQPSIPTLASSPGSTLSSESSSVALSSSTTRSDGFTVSLPNLSTGPGASTVSSILTAPTSGPSSTVAPVLSTSAPLSVPSSSSLLPSTASPGLPTLSSSAPSTSSSPLASSSGSLAVSPSLGVSSLPTPSSANPSDFLTTPGVTSLSTGSLPSISSVASIVPSVPSAPATIAISSVLTPSTLLSLTSPSSSILVNTSSSSSSLFVPILSLSSTTTGFSVVSSPALTSLPSSTIGLVSSSSSTSSATASLGSTPEVPSAVTSTLSLNLTSSFTSSTTPISVSSPIPLSSLSSAPPTSAVVPISSTTFVTFIPSTNISSSPSTNLASSLTVTSPTSSSPALSSISTTATSALNSSLLGSLPVSPSTLTSTLTFISTAPPGVSPPAIGTAASSSLSISLSDSLTVASSTLVSTSILTTTAPPVASPSAPSAVNATSLFLLRAMTKVISYGDTAVSFVFPSPNITTTMSYWTGVYPTVTGPMPSDLQTIPLTTRTERQTPLSALPSFTVFSSRSRRFKTVVTTIYYDSDETSTALAKRQVIPITSALPTPTLETTVLGTTTVALPDLPGPSSCGESGNFTLNFDDTVVGGDNSSLLVANGMNNPYHHMFYANGYTYVPDMWEPYPSISQPNVAMFLPLIGRLFPNNPFAGTLLPGEIGAGPRASVDAYWFNAYAGYFGCALNGLEPCTLRISGYRYDAVLKQEVLVAEQNATLPACWGYINCRLTQVYFNDQFQALSGIQFNAYTYALGIPQVHMMDDLQLEWYNDTCSAGIQRIGHR